MNRITSFFRIDEQVFFSMAGLCIFGILVLAFRVATHHECAPVKIMPSAVSFKIDNTIRFTAESKTGQSFSWNFGDGAVTDDATATTSHIYKKPGRYTVSVMVDGKCSDFQNLTIEDAPMVANAGLWFTFKAPDTAYVNVPVTFEDTL